MSRKSTAPTPVGVAFTPAQPDTADEMAVLDVAYAAQDAHEATRRPRGNPKTAEAAQATHTSFNAIHNA